MKHESNDEIQKELLTFSRQKRPQKEIIDYLKKFDSIILSALKFPLPNEETSQSHQYNIVDFAIAQEWTQVTPFLLDEKNLNSTTSAFELFARMTTNKAVAGLFQKIKSPEYVWYKKEDGQKIKIPVAQFCKQNNLKAFSNDIYVPGKFYYFLQKNPQSSLKIMGTNDAQTIGPQLSIWMRESLDDIFYLTDMRKCGLGAVANRTIKASTFFGFYAGVITHSIFSPNKDFFNESARDIISTYFSSDARFSFSSAQRQIQVDKCINKISAIQIRNINYYVQHLPSIGDIEFYVFSDTTTKKSVATANIEPIVVSYKDMYVPAYISSKEIAKDQIVGVNYDESFWIKSGKWFELLNNQGQIISRLGYRKSHLSCELYLAERNESIIVTIPGPSKDFFKKGEKELPDLRQKTLNNKNAVLQNVKEIYSVKSLPLLQVLKEKKDYPGKFKSSIDNKIIPFTISYEYLIVNCGLQNVYLPQIDYSLMEQPSDVKRITRSADAGYDLRKAAYENDFSTVREILSSDAIKDIDCIALGDSSSKRTALHRAAEQGNAAIVLYLLANGADRNKQDKDGKTPEQIATGPAAIVFKNLSSPVKIIEAKIEEDSEKEAESEEELEKGGALSKFTT